MMIDIRKVRDFFYSQEPEHTDSFIAAYVPELLDELEAARRVIAVAIRLVNRVIAQGEIQDDEISQLPVSELKDAIDRYQGDYSD